MSTQRTEEQPPESAPPIVPVKSDGAALAEFLSERPAPVGMPPSAAAVLPVARSRRNALVAIGVVVLAAGFFWVAPRGRISNPGPTVEAPRVIQAQAMKSPDQ